MMKISTCGDNDKSREQLLSELSDQKELRRRQQEELSRLKAERETEQRYCPFFNSMQEGVCLAELIYDESGRPSDCLLLELNKAAETITGFDSQAITGQSALILFPDADRAWIDSVHSVVSTGVPLQQKEFCSSLKKWFSVRVFRIEKNKFAFMFFDITEHQEARKELDQLVEQLAREKHALTESEQRYRMMGEILPYGIWLCDAEGKADYISQSFLDLLDMSMEDIKGFAWTEKLLSEDVEPMMKKWMHCMQTGEDWDYEHRIIDRSGKMHTVLSRGRPIRDKEGKITAWAGINLDTTERKRVQSSLRESEDRLATELDMANRLHEISTRLIQADKIETLYEKILDTAMAIMHSDFASIQMLEQEDGTSGKLELLGHRGFSAQAAQLWKWVDVSSESSCGAALRAGARVIVQDVMTCDFMQGSQDLKAYLQSGIRSVQTTPLVARSGEIIGMLSTHWRKPHAPAGGELRSLDVLARQAADLIDRKQNEVALQQTRDRLQAVLDAVPAGVVVADTKGRILLASDYTRKIIGHPVTGDAHGPESGYEIYTMNGATIPMGQLPLSLALSGKKISDTELSVRRSDGSQAIILASATPLQSHKGDIWGAVTVFQDITQRKEAERKLKELTTTLEIKVAERTKLANDRARQLQALAVELIQAEERERRQFAHLLHDDLQQLLAAAKMQLQAVVENLPEELLLKNVGEILDESIAKTRRLSHELSPAVLNHSGLFAGLQWLTEQMKQQFGLLVELEKEIIPEVENPVLNVFLFRAVQELLFNTTKHSGVKEARVVLSGSDEALSICVSDKGKGFDIEVLESNSGKTGFGLMSIRERASYIGGSLVVESRPGHGSRFILTVPLERVTVDKSPDTTIPQISGMPAASDLPVNQGCVRVLCVDDHKVMRQGLIGLISGQPEIEIAGEAADGMEAVELARQIRPDVIIMDVSMPEMDGVEATRRIKAELPETRVVGLSMHDDEDIRRVMSAAGADALISKTASLVELLNVIYGSN